MPENKYELKIALALFLFFSNFLFIQAQPGLKVLKALRVEEAPRLDGTLSDSVWQKAEPAKDFFQYEPHNDRPASFESEVRIVFTDESIFVGAMLYDPHPDSILTESGLRDASQKLNADQFYVDINPFNDGIYGFRFMVSASGVETDINMSGEMLGMGNEFGDITWDAVWQSRVSITDEGWIVEMEIPYSALRFPRRNIEDWGINFWREIRRSRESSSWNFVDRSLGNVIGSMGLLSGMKGIKPPLRLAFFPYAAAYLEKNGVTPGWKNLFNMGMDVKLGLSESFTLDMTLIPDFGQVPSDAQILNLTPYEVQFDEKRQFFTEGTELFSKAGLFYSRRIGAQPKGWNNVKSFLEEHEIIYSNPQETKLINASKFSGRTSGGLGMGVFNGMTAASQATLLDTITNQTRKLTTQPFTNYNLVVFDQSLPNNSYVSLINTNVSGLIQGYTANVSGLDFRLLNRSKMYRISGYGTLSQQYFTNKQNRFGYKYFLNLGKFGGTWQYSYARGVVSDTYEQNDLGFLQRNNEVTDQLMVSFNVFKPFMKILNYSTGLNLAYTRLFEPNSFTGSAIGCYFNILFDSRLFFFFNAMYQPMGTRDYFEPRVPGRFYEIGKAWLFSLMYSTDYRKRIFVDGNIEYSYIHSDYEQQGYAVFINPTFRASNQLSFSYGLNFGKKKNDIGYVEHWSPDSVFFGLRQSPTTINTLRASYIFNNHLSLDFDLRHYWSRVLYQGTYFILKTNGGLEPWPDSLPVDDINYNAFTIDSKITWNFAPGSQLSLVWKNIINTYGGQVSHNFLKNLERTLNEPQINSLSLKILYYIDYPMILRSVEKVFPQHS